ncbi:MAG: 1-acyl-sn-glycerol-3-phosphate acyltransferase [Motiliproteus sp.]|jgi:1-acyl-sn-glycerol-3-phosphate acyltransferase
MSYVRAFLFYLVMITATVLHSTLCLIFASGLPFRLRFKIVSSVNHLFIGWLRVICGVRYELVGKEHLPQDRPYVLLVNHQSEWETIYLQLLVQPISTVLKKELLRIPFFGWALALLRPIAIDRAQRSGAMKQLLKQGKQRLGEGIPVVIFPQGTRVPVGQQGKFTKGGALLACSAKVPVVPMVHNAGEHWPSGRFTKVAGVIRIEIGEPIVTEGRGVEEVYQLSTDWIQSRLPLAQVQGPILGESIAE